VLFGPAARAGCFGRCPESPTEGALEEKRRLVAFAFSVLLTVEERAKVVALQENDLALLPALKSSMR
jgi:hypothetical protein